MLEAAKYIGSGIATIGLAGAGLDIGVVFSGLKDIDIDRIPEKLPADIAVEIIKGSAALVGLFLVVGLLALYVRPRMPKFCSLCHEFTFNPTVDSQGTCRGCNRNVRDFYR